MPSNGHRSADSTAEEFKTSTGNNVGANSAAGGFMEWLFMVEQPHTSFTSSSPMPKQRLKCVAGNNWNTDIWDNPVLPTLWPPFGEGPSLF